MQDNQLPKDASLESKLPTMVICMAALAIVLLALSLGSQYELVSKGQKWTAIGGARFKILLGAALLGGASIIGGFVVAWKWKARRAWGLVAAGLGFAPLLVLAGLLSLNFYTKVMAVKKKVIRAHSFANINEVVGQPIPSGREIFTWQQERKIYAAWYQRHLVLGYQQSGSRNPVWDVAVESLIRDYINSFAGEAGGPDAKTLFAKANGVLATGCNDPVALYVAAAVQLENNESARLYRLARERMAASGYSPAVKWLAEVNYAALAQNKQETAAVAQADQQAMNLLRQSFAKKDFQDNEFFVLKYLLQDGAGRYWKLRHEEEFCRLLETTEGCPEWFALLFRGQAFIDAAWKARGNGSASKVTPQGWEGFRTNLKLAGEKLARAWELQPSDPSAASEMIRVKMGHSEDPLAEMRLWFGRAVAARFDFYPAYDNLVFALRPRWHGSHEAMLEFGEACLKTGRFDTTVPRYFNKAVIDVANEMGREVYQRPGLNQKLRIMFTGYAAESRDEASRRLELTSQFMATYWAKNYKECLADLEQLSFQPDAAMMADWHGNYDWLPGWIKAWNGLHQELAVKAEAARDAQRFGESADFYRQLAGLVQGDKFLKDWADESLQTVEFEQAYHSGNWTPLPLTTNLSGWRPYLGNWKMNADGSLDGGAGITGMMLKSLANIGDNFGMRGSVEMVFTTTGDYQAGIVFGALHPNDGEWLGFRVRHSGKDGDEAILSRWYSRDIRRTKLSLNRRNTFELTLHNGTITALINDSKVVDALPLKQTGSHFHEDLAVGLGAYSDQNEYVIRFRDLEVKKLTPTPVPGRPPVLPRVNKPR